MVSWYDHYDKMQAMIRTAALAGLLSIQFSAVAGSIPDPQELRLQPPVVRSMFPLGGQAGHTVVVEFEGDFLDRTVLRCECDDLTTKVRRATAVRTEIEFDLGARMEPGPRIIYLQSPRGISNRLIFRVTGWRSMLEQEANDTLAQAQTVAAPAVVEGRVARLTDVDFFRFHAAAGERLAFNVMAKRSNAPGFVAITLLSASGRELAHNNARIGPDAYLDYTFREAGDYAVVVTPRRFADFFTVVKDDQLINWQYQLAIGRSPVVWSVYPMGGKRGSSVEAELHADFLSANAGPSFSGKGIQSALTPTSDPCACKHKLDIRIAEDAEPGLHWLSVPDDSGNAMPLGFWVGDGPELMDAGTRPQNVELPVTINGRISKADDRGVFRIKVNQDDEVTFELDARTLGSRMTDPQLILMRAGGEIVTAADERCRKCSKFDSTVRRKEMLDPKLTHAFISASANDADAAGEYDAVVIDNSSGESSDRPYRLTIRKKQPYVLIGVSADHVQARAGQAAKVPVAVMREEGFEGDVPVTARGLPPGWTVRPLVISKGSDTGDLEIVRDDGSPSTASIEVASDALTAALPPVVGEDGFGYLERARTKITVSFVESPQFALRIEEQPGGFVIEQKSPVPVEIPVMVERIKGFDASLTFALEDAPDGVSIKSQDASHVWLVADRSSAKPGKYRIALRAAATREGRELTEVSTGFRLQVK
jgi:hypothetical protein